jgi:hypothetical protein
LADEPTNAVREFNPVGIEKEMFVNVASLETVISASFVFVVPFTTLITVPIAPVLMFMFCTENISSSLNMNPDVNLIVAADDGNRVCWAYTIVAQG